jgi:hypothetical protein
MLHRLPKRSTRAAVESSRLHEEEEEESFVEDPLPKAYPTRSSRRQSSEEVAYDRPQRNREAIVSTTSSRNRSNQEASNQFILRLSNRRAQVEQQAPAGSSRSSSRVAADCLANLVSGSMTSAGATRSSDLRRETRQSSQSMGLQSTLPKRSTRKPVSYVDEGSEAGDYEEEEEEDPLPRRSSRKRSHSEEEVHRDEDSDSSLNINGTGRRSKRNRRNVSYAYDDKEEDDDEDTNVKSIRSSSSRRSMDVEGEEDTELTIRRSSRRRNEKQVIEEDDDEMSDEEETMPRRRSGRQPVESSTQRSLISTSSTSNRARGDQNQVDDDEADRQSSSIHSKRLDPDFKRRVLKLLYIISEADEHQVFAHPITDDEVPGYSDIISMPMDLSTIR